MSTHSFSNWADRENILLAMTPAFFHVLDGDVGRQPGGQRADGSGDFSR